MVQNKTTMTRNGVTATRTTSYYVRATKDLSTIAGDDVTTYVGDSMPADSGFKASATGKDGKSIAVTLDKSQVDMSKVGDYAVTITATDGQTKTVQVHVLENQQSIQGNDVTAYVGDSVPADKEFKASATGKDGKSIAVTLDKSQVDMSKVGDYAVTITATDGQTKTVQVHVLENQQSIQGNDVTAYVGDSVPADSGFKASATGKDGKSIAVTLDKSQVDMNQVGDYEVVITATDGQKKTVYVHVKDLSTIAGYDVTTYVGDSVPADKEFKASATGKDGKSIAVTLDKSQVDMNQVGDYEVVITATDGQKKTVYVHVKDLSTIAGYDVTTYVGDSVPADKEFKASATGKDGKSIAVTLDKNQVDMNQVGDYEVVITATDGQKKTVYVHVKDLSTIAGYDVTIYVGDSIPADSEFKASATGKDGKLIAVTLDKSQVDMNQVGDYPIIITATDGQTKTVYVHVLEKKSAKDIITKYVDEKGIEIHETQTIHGYIGESYDASISTYKLKIDGYTLDETKLPDNATGNFSDKVQTVTYIYTKNPVKSKGVIVNYLDEAGNQIAKSIPLAGNIGDSYTSEQKNIEGYTFKEVQGNATGTFADESQTITYVYTKNPTPTDPVIPNSDGGSRFPQTGEEVKQLNLYVGTFLIVLVGLFYITEKKRKII